MLDEIRILQLGTEDWSEKYELPYCAIFQYAKTFTDAPKKPYDLVFIDRTLTSREINALRKATKAYTLFVTENIAMEGRMVDFFEEKKGKYIAIAEIQPFLQNEIRNYFPEHYGEKFQFKNLSIAQGFSGKVKWDGNYCVTLQGDFGEEIKQIAFWRNNIPVFKGQAIDFWLEYQKDPDVTIALSITQFVQGSLSDIQQKWTFTEEELEQVVQIDNQLADGPVFASLLAKGNGSLRIIALHDRYSRRGHGHFLPGGERYVTSSREEVFCYFDPGDRKPPLNVYFSGYKTKQGFEGYNLMRKMDAPFLLISEPRLEGGSFYMGTQEYEDLIRNAIQKYMKELGFSGEQVLLAGMSMGTYGALYYGCDIRPHAMILGKPLASIGDVAANETLHRPGGFPTSLDVLKYLCGDMNEAAVEQLNNRFWEKFDKADWSKSKFVISYMLEDDYDRTAYEKLISHLWSEGVQVYGKGIHGRHNDDTGGIVSWFASQFRKVLREDFGRGMEE